MVYTLARLQKLWSRIGAASDPKMVHQQIMNHYTEPHRKFHNLDHIDHCLAQFDQLPPGLAQDPDAIETAILFHDIIYSVDPAWYPVNEAESSLFAFHLLLESRVPAAFNVRVKKMIDATTHQLTLTDPDQQLVADIDLSTLGVSPQQFTTNSANIRAEFDNVPDQDFWPYQVTLLGGFLKHQNLYYTEYFRDRLETQARANLRRQLRVSEEKVASLHL